MTTAEYNEKAAKIRASREIGKAMLAGAVARGYGKKAQRVRFSLIDEVTQHPLVGRPDDLTKNGQ